MIQEAASPPNEIQRQGVPIIYLVDDDPSFLRALSRRLRAAARRMQRQKREWSARYESLTPRERELFALVVRGLVNKQIADVLGICERTVKAHRGQVMHQMGVQSPAESGRAVEWLGEIFESASARQTESE